MESTIQSALTTPTEAILTFDQTGQLCACDAGALAIFGYTAAEMLGRPAGDLLPDAWPGPAEPGGARLEAPPGLPLGPGRHLVRGRHKDGTTFALELAPRDLYLAGQQLVCAVVRPYPSWTRDAAPGAGLPSRRTAGLAALEQAIMEPHKLQAVLDQIVDATCALLPASAGATLILWDPAPGAAYVRAASRPGRPAPDGLHVRREGGPTRWMVAHRQPFVVPDTRSDPFQTTHMLPEYEFRAYAGVPLAAEGIVFGALYALDRQPRPYTPADLEFLQALANRAALAIARVHLARQAQRAHDAWRESAARFRTFVESLGEGLLICDLDNTVTYASARTAALSGYAPQELVGQRVTEVLVPPEEWPGSQRRATGRLPEIANPHPILLTRKDSSRIWVDLHVSPLRNAAGEIVGTLAVLTDITERMRAEEALRESEDRYRSLFDQSLDAVVLGTLDGAVLATNPAAAHIFGRGDDEIRQIGWNGLFDLADSRLLGALAERARTGRFKGELTFQRQDGTTFPGEVSSVIFQDREGAERTSMIIRDVTERKQAEAALQQANAQLRSSVVELQGRTREMALLNEMGDMLQTCLTAEEAYDVVVSFAARLFVGEAGALYLLNAAHNTLRTAAAWGEPTAIKPVFPPNDCWALRSGRPYRTGGRLGGPPCGHLDQNHASDSLCVPLMAQGETVGVFCLQTGAADTLLAETQQRVAVALGEHVALALANLKLRATLQSQAIRDSLTGLFNRRYMEESLEREIHRANRSGHPLGIIMVDVDHFKDVNDQFGHAAGDRLLTGLGQFLQTKIRGADLACRYGGEEFILILPETAREVARRRAEELRNEAKYLRVQYGTQTLGLLSLSLGVATYPEQGTTVETIVRAADEALYQAKTAGRDRVVMSARRKDLVPVPPAGGTSGQP